MPALQAVLDRMAAAARAAGRDPADIALIAVTKMQAWATIEPILAAGQSRFGENRVQEAQSRWAERREGLELRLIGALQRPAQTALVVEHEMSVVPGMVADRVAGFGFPAHDARIGLDGTSDDEKSRVNAFGPQHGQNLVGVRRIRAVVVG